MKYVCDVCNWVYDEELGDPEMGIVPGTKFEDLPDDFECPLCGVDVEDVTDSELKKNPHDHDAELVVTRTGLKQYIHTTCWHDMIREKRPYNGKLYL